MRLQARESVAAQRVFTKVERQGCHDLAPAVAVSDTSAASGAMRVDQDEEVADEMRLHEFQNTLFVPWLQRLSVAELDALGETKGATLACELEKVQISTFDNDEGRIRDEFKKQVPWLSGTDTSYVKFTTAPKGSLKSKIHVLC